LLLVVAVCAVCCCLLLLFAVTSVSCFVFCFLVVDSSFTCRLQLSCLLNVVSKEKAKVNQKAAKKDAQLKKKEQKVEGRHKEYVRCFG